jgi:hypothetical protein
MAYTEDLNSGLNATAAAPAWLASEWLTSTLSLPPLGKLLAGQGKHPLAAAACQAAVLVWACLQTQANF